MESAPALLPGPDGAGAESSSCLLSRGPGQRETSASLWPRVAEGGGGGKHTVPSACAGRAEAKYAELRSTNVAGFWGTQGSGRLRRGWGEPNQLEPNAGEAGCEGTRGCAGLGAAPRGGRASRAPHAAHPGGVCAAPGRAGPSCAATLRRGPNLHPKVEGSRPGPAASTPRQQAAAPGGPGPGAERPLRREPPGPRPARHQAPPRDSDPPRAAGRVRPPAPATKLWEAPPGRGPAQQVPGPAPRSPPPCWLRGRRR